MNVLNHETNKYHSSQYLLRILTNGGVIFITIIVNFMALNYHVNSATSSGKTYYVSPTGNDSNSGTSTLAAWQTLAKVNAFAFQPGDTILFERNGVWTGTGALNSTALVIHPSGIAGAPISFGAYGTGSLPVIMNPPITNNTRDVVVYGSYIIFQNFMLKDAHGAGIYTGASTHNDVISNLEITNTGFGIMLSGTYQLATQNYIHDLHMIVNTPGGNDDFGAVGINLYYVSNSEISYNRIVGCQAPSYDYGTDGGALEWFGTSDNNYAHNNWAENDNGFVEIGGNNGEHAYNNVLAYNVSLNNGDFSVLHVSGTYGIDASFNVENNTIIETQPHSSLLWAMIGFTGTPNANTYILRNNLFYLGDVRFLSPADSYGWVFTHDHNLYQFLNYKTILGFSLGTGEKITTLQLKDPANGDFHLQSSSPAINAGLPLGFTLDFDDLPVPINQNPDIGAFDSQNIITTSGKFIVSLPLVLNYTTKLWIIGGIVILVIMGVFTAWKVLNRPLGLPLKLVTDRTTSTLPVMVSSSQSSSPTSTSSNNSPSGNAKQCPGSGSMLILVIGRDQTHWRVPYGADLIRLVKVDFDHNTIAMYALPRDLLLDTPHLSVAQYMLGPVYYYVWQAEGNDQAADVEATLAVAQIIYDNFGVQADHYMTVDESVLTTAVNMVGGIEVNVPAAVNVDEPDLTLHLVAGVQEMDGETVQNYVRYVMDNSLTDEWGRFDRQAAVLYGLVAKLVSPEVFPKVPELYNEFSQNIVTDLTPSQILSMACLAKTIPYDQIKSGAVKQAMVTIQGDAMVLNNLAAFKQTLQDFFK